MINTKKTKIVATLGPTCSTEEELENIFKAGVNIVRLNFSHGEYEAHKNTIDRVRKVSEKLHTSIGLMADLSGPKIRTGDLENTTLRLVKGAKIILTTKKVIGNKERLFVNYKHLAKEIKKGSHILLDDGRRDLKVLSISGDDITCRIIQGGLIKSRRGVNLPGTDLRIKSITDKDKADIVFAAKNNVDYFALSFVRSASDIKQLKKLVAKAGSDARIIAKIETSQAIDNIDDIIEESDAIMVARGDLAVEVRKERVPLLQKSIIRKCNIAGKPVITATQMLESMVSSSVPTRAEVSDVANAILDGTDAVMLSQETAFGQFPLEAVKVMSEVALRVENHYPHREQILNSQSFSKELRKNSVVNTITMATVRTAIKVDAKVIVALTETGFSARMISRYRPTQPILALSVHERVVQKMTLYYGCHARKIVSFEFVSQVIDDLKELVLKEKLAKKGDKIVIVAGVPMGREGGTNMCLVEVM